MLGRLMPREERFFELFNAHAERIVEGSRELAAMIGSFTELDAHAERIDAAERAADKITQRDLRPVEMYTTVAVVYFVICYALSRLVKRLQARIAIIR